MKSYVFDESSGDDTTLKGALAIAEGDMDVAVGGDLTVASVQDTGSIDGSSSGFSAGLSYGLGGGDWGDRGGETGTQDSESGDEDDDGPSALDRMGLKGSVSHGDEKGRKAWVREQSGLVAGGDVNVEVGGHTQLDGAVVASTGGDVTLETETLGYSDIRDHDDYRNVNTSIGGSLSLGGLFGDEDASAEAEERGSTGDAILDTIAKLPTVEGAYEVSERDQITRATVAAPTANATHKHEKVRAWLAKRPRFHMHFTPTSSSWLNLVERFFADLTGDVIRAGSFASVRELVADIKAYLTQRNAEPRPCKWKAEGAAILEKIQRARAALDRAETAK